MKRMFSLLLLVLLLAGCSKTPAMESPKTFYYCRRDIQFHSEEGVLVGEVRETAACEQSLLPLLDLYLSGPELEDLYCPIPENAKVLDAVLEDGNLVITMSPQFAGLTGIELSLACHCLGLTAIELQPAQAVTIRCDDHRLDGAAAITIKEADLLLVDSGAQGDN